MLNCQEFITQSDMSLVTPNIIYYRNTEGTFAQMNKRYGLKKVNNTYIITVDNDIEDEDAMNIDLQTRYLILRMRGCEDIVPNFSKIALLKYLSTLFTDHFKADETYHLLYLYLYLYTNALLLNYKEELLVGPFVMHDIASQVLLDKIQQLYDYLYVYYTILN